jgi:hypothetical protein
MAIQQRTNVLSGQQNRTSALGMAAIRAAGLAHADHTATAASDATLKNKTTQKLQQAQDRVSTMFPDELSIDFHVPVPMHPDAESTVKGLTDIRLDDIPGVIKETKDSIRQVVDSILNDNPFIKSGDMVPYPVIPEADKAAARSRATIPAIRQPLISSSGDVQNPVYNEPINLVVKGTKQQLTNALKEAGWVQAHEQSFWNNLKVGISSGTGLMDYPEGPVSDMFLHGERHMVAFNKNVDSNNTRDHLRIWPMGKNEWAIAATRDTAAIAWIDVDVTLKRDGWKPDLDIEPSFRSSHLIDPQIDGERDLVLTDLLSTGRVKNWEMVPGKRTSVEEAAMERRRMETDGHVYLVDLTRQPKNTK